jgi:hypothetical protein
MPRPPAHGDAVLFEIADFALCLKLFEHLRTRSPGYLTGRSDARFVAVPLDPDDVSLEMLLDTVSEWAAQVGLRVVTFHIGEQMSVLVAKHPGDDAP